ncbi:MAG TPA: alcohol dehydrogenase catalytic domain-containing protein, partial [Nitrolancea sp.]|nr:alcohol dehydrogenase catalytic domain-containing protein [Nitrolancea sp.]
MQAMSLLLVGPEELAWTSAELGAPGSNEILVKTVAGAISIGTELPHFRGTSRSDATTYPAMTGYESVARVLACGAEVERLQPGDRVVAFYGHRTHAIIPEAKAIIIPHDVSDEVALLAILSCDVGKGISKLAPAPDDAVLITGGGTIGLLALWTLKQHGVRHVDLLEPLVLRRRLASEFGATAVFDMDGAEQSEIRYACGFECSSRDAAFGLLQRKLRHDGAICVLADG